MKTIVSSKIDADIKQQLDDFSNKSGLSLSDVIEIAISNFIKDVDLSEQMKTEIDNLVSNSIILDIRKLDIKTFAFFLELSDKVKSKSNEMVMQRLVTKFTHVYGDIEQKYIEKSQIIKSKLK